MKAFVKWMLFAAMSLCSVAALGQEGHDFYKQRADEYLAKGDGEGAQRSYSVWRELTGKRDPDIESRIAACNKKVSAAQQQLQQQQPESIPNVHWMWSMCKPTANLTNDEFLSAARNNIRSLDLESLLYAGAVAQDNAEKACIYSYTAEKYNDARAYNNLGVALGASGKYADAKNAFNKSASLKSSPEVSNNLGALALAQGYPSEAKRYLNAVYSPEANFNKGLVALNEGNYAVAANTLSGYDAAFAALLNGDSDKASQLLANDTSAEGYYLKAVIAARQNNANDAISNLKNAIGKNASLKERAKTDIEFVKLFDNPAFKAL